MFIADALIWGGYYSDYHTSNSTPNALNSAVIAPKRDVNRIK